MQATMPEKGYVKNAWILLAVLGVIGILFGVALTFNLPVDTAFIQNQLGQTTSSFQSSNPKAYSLVQTLTRDSGVILLGYSILATGIAYTAFRRGMKWAWYVSLYLPLFLLYFTAETYYFGGNNWPLYAIFFLVSLAGIFLPYRKFFPK